MTIEKLEEFASNGDKHLTGLDVATGFPRADKPERPWFNKLFGDITGKINEVVDSIDGLPPFEGGVLADTFVVVDGSLSQRTINRGLESIAELSTVKNPKDGLRVYVKSYHTGHDNGGGYFTYDSSKSAINDGVVTFNGWVREDKGYVTFRDGGAIGDGITAEWANIKKVIAYGFENNVIVDGEGLTYLTTSIYMNSNLYLRNAYFVCSSNENMTSVLITDSDPNTWFENVTFENVHIDGMRQIATGLPTGAFDEDGGRHGFRIVKRCRNIRFIDSGADNCCVDGLMFYPRLNRELDYGSMVVGIRFEGECHFNNNGRWGISADAVDRFSIGDGTIAKGNGLDLVVGAAIETGNASRKYLGFEYGGAVVFEEYHGNYSSHNITIGAVDFRDNASSSLAFTRTGVIVTPSSGIQINSGGLYNAGISTNVNPEKTAQKAAIRMSGYTVHGQDANLYRNVVIDNIDCGGGSLYLDGVNNSDLYGYLNCSKVYLRYSQVRADTKQVYELIESSSNYEAPTARITKEGTYFGALTQTVGVFNFAGINSANLNLFSNGIVQGGIRIVKEDSGIRTEFYESSGTTRATISKYGAIYPGSTGVATLGLDPLRYKDIYLTNAPNVTSDRTLKKDIEQLTAVELLVAQELKGLIKKYKLKSDDARLRVGVIAQEVEIAFSNHGLNALDYNMIDKTDGMYSIRYEELILFIITSV